MRSTKRHSPKSIQKSFGPEIPMKRRITSHLVVLGLVTFAIAGGCGGDDETAKPGSVAGRGGSGGGGSGGSDKGGTGASTSGGEPGAAGDLGLGGGSGSPEPTGSVCQEAADCYAGLDTDELAGDVACIDKVEDGYCTHECETDDDCCAVEGECRTGFKQVCASFENTDVKYCFLSCEDEDLVAAGGAAGASGVDANEYCEREANPRFICRSTGGGVENRLACLPDGGMGGAGPGMGGAGGMSMGGGGAGGAGGDSMGGGSDGAGG
jgi:hypothetical protein